jgi:hypothetical protein
MKSADRFISAQSLAILSCLAVVAGAMSLVLAAHRGPMPILDQWEVEGIGLYKPYFEGHLRFSDLLSPYAEHRMFFTRALSLALLEIRGAWDPIWESVANISFRLLAISLLLIFLISRLISTPQAIAVAAFCAIINAIPFTMETIIIAYPSNFYLALLFGLGALLLLDRSAAWSEQWWLGTLLGVLSYFNLASGLFTLLAADSVIYLQIILGVRPRKDVREWTGLAFHLALAVLMYLGVPSTDPGMVQFKAESPAQFAEAMAVLVAWPLPAPFFPLVYGPAIMVLGLLIIRRPPPEDERWRYIMLLAWLVLQFVVLAYGRGSITARIGIAPRYVDIASVGILLNFTIVLYLMRSIRVTRLAYALAGCWIAAVCVAGVRYVPIDSDLWEKTQNIQLDIDTGNIPLLVSKLQAGAHPESERIIQLVSDPAGRKFLPPDLIGADSEKFVQSHTYLHGVFSKPAVMIRDFVLQSGHGIIALGFALHILALTRGDQLWDAPPQMKVPMAPPAAVKFAARLFAAALVCVAAVPAFNSIVARIAIARATWLAPTLLPVTRTADAPLIGTLDSLQTGKDGQLTVSGWAFNRMEQHRPVYVAVSVDGKIAAAGPTTEQRPDVSKDYKLGEDAAPSGFRLTAHACTSTAHVTVFAFTMEGHANVLAYAENVACPAGPS